MRSALAGLALLAVGCAHRPELARSTSTPHWSELTSRHFVLRTDMPRRQARSALAEFERSYAAMETIAFSSDPPRQRIDVVLFAGEDQFRALAPPGSSGYFMPRQVDDPDPQPTIALYGKMEISGTLVDSTERRFRHELTHRFLERRLRDAPPWLEEGLAEYWSTLKTADREALVGVVPNRKIFRVDIHRNAALSQNFVEERVELTDVPSVWELLSADYSTFHDPARAFSYYAAAWTFVHMMLNGPYGHAARFNRFVDAMAAGTPMPDAWRAAFWGVSLTRLDRELRDYLLRDDMDPRYSRFVVAPVPQKPERERGLGADEVHLMMARIRPWDSRESILAAGFELAQARALTHGAASPELHYWSALYATRWRRFAVAEAELRQALAVEPSQPRHWLALAELLARADRREPVDTAALEDAVAHLVPLATSAQALNFIARYYSAKGEIDAGLPFARRAVAAERNCWECVDTLATLQNLAHAKQPASDVYTKPGIY